MKYAVQPQTWHHRPGIKSRAFVLYFVLAFGCRMAAAQQVQVTLDPAETHINISVHDVHGGVHGSFKLKTGSVTFDRASGVASGQIVVDAASGVTGNDTRDRKMRQEVLQSNLYPEIIFSPTRVVGEVATQGSSNVQVQGSFRIHGASHDIELTVPVQISGDKLTATTNFVVPYESWGMKNPSVLFLRVDGKAEVSITASGHIAVISGGNTVH